MTNLKYKNRIAGRRPLGKSDHDHQYPAKRVRYCFIGWLVVARHLDICLEVPFPGSSPGLHESIHSGSANNLKYPTHHLEQQLLGMNPT